MNAIVLSQNPFSPPPKIFNAVDMVFAFGKADLAMKLEDDKDNHFACGSPSTFSFADTTKTAFIQFNIAIKHLGTFLKTNTTK